jgi:hypothetical protein
MGFGQPSKEGSYDQIPHTGLSAEHPKAPHALNYSECMGSYLFLVFTDFSNTRKHILFPADLDRGCRGSRHRSLR